MTFTPKNGFVAAPYSQDGSRQSMNITTNAGYTGGNWVYLQAGTASRMEFGADGAIRAFTAISGTGGATISWIGGSISGLYVLRAGDTMTGALTINAAGTSLNISNNAIFGGSLTVAGIVNSGSSSAASLTVTGATSTNTLGVTTSATIGTLSVTGASTALAVTNDASVGGALTIAGAGTALAVTNNATIGGTVNTHTIPSVTADTFAMLNATQTLANKTLPNTSVITVKAANLTVQDGTDTTKRLAFALSGITTGTTRTLTIPNASGTIALTSNTLGDFASTTSAQLAGVISDETGSGALVFGTLPTLTGAVVNTIGGGTANDTLKIVDTTVAASNPNKYLRVASGSLQVVNSAFTTSILTLTNTGDLSFGGALTLGVGKLVSPSPSGRSYGSLSVWGQTNGYAGIAFHDGSGTYLGTLMVNGANNVWGVYDEGNSAWRWYWNGGTLTVGTVPVANVSGLANSATTTAATAATASTIVLRDGSGGITTGAISSGAISSGTITASASGTGASGSHFLNDIVSYRTTTTGVVYLGSDVNHYLYYDSSNYILAGASLVVNGTTYTSGAEAKRGIASMLAPDKAKLRALQPRRFRYAHEPDSAPERLGFIAEEVQAAYPQAVQSLPSTGANGETLTGGLGLDPMHMVALLWQRVVALEDDLAALSARVRP